jgi:hypothetical protein
MPLARRQTSGSFGRQRHGHRGVDVRADRLRVSADSPDGMSTGHDRRSLALMSAATVSKRPASGSSARAEERVDEHVAAANLREVQSQACASLISTIVWPR